MTPILMVLGLMLGQPAKTAQIQTCNWPHLCEKPQLVQVGPCVYPRVCAQPPLAQIQPCVWPNRCEAAQG